MRLLRDHIRYGGKEQLDQNVAKYSFPNHALVLGGAASGKSAFAEQQILDTGLEPIYIATSQAYDAEMQDKIDKHRLQRGPGWTTIEEPHDIASALSQAPRGSAVLVDCATLWLSNLMMKEANIAAAEEALLRALDTCPASVTIVSNEVGMGIVPDNAMARRFRGIQGQFNQTFAAACATVVFVTAGLPQFLKGKP